MVVIVIIGLLATMVVPNVLARLGAAAEGTVRADLVTLKNAIDQFAIENSGRYPESLQRLVEKDDKGRSYLDMEEVPVDPWKNEYQYINPDDNGNQLELFSLGKDGAPGGEGEDADIRIQDVRR